ncbi:hypothetical protein [Arthrobacter sp. SD76]|uniref:hypothetical protein n=1 Tax=Arthrobacter sp. SD76 TaxID=3415007 RepID=UPI003C7675DC
MYEEILGRLGFALDLDALVATLSPTQRALLAVARAMRLLNSSSEQHLFILDEPTAALPKHEASELLQLMRRMADLGAGVIFVSHRLGEVMEVCDRATIMRKGRDVRTTDIKNTTRSDIVAEMLGQRMDDFFPDPPIFDDTTVRLEVTGLTGDKIENVSFAIRGSEIVGFTGLTGMGQEELPYLIAGDLPVSAGTVAVDGSQVTFTSPRFGHPTRRSSCPWKPPTGWRMGSWHG